MAVFLTRTLFVNKLSLRSQKKPQGEIWTLTIIRTTLLLSLEDTSKAISRLVELTKFKNEEQVFTATRTLI